MSAPAVAAPAKVCPACNARYGDEVGFCSRDGTPLVVDPTAGRADLVGQVLADRYRVTRLIGEGGMGQVYEAHHVNINKRFAIKLLRPEIVSNPEAVTRFKQEAWSASSIGHDNIIEIHDFATLPNGAVYLAMEFLQGRPLSERMRAAPPLAIDEALDILLQVCRGLDAAHSKNIVHRDMKPENIFLAQKGPRVVVKILDFGIAKVSGAEGSKSLTRTGTIFGTPHYMSPEQALGRTLDHRSDIYSLGIIMYEAFSGRVPFEAETFMGILTKHITVAATPPSQIAPDRQIPAEVEAVIMKAIAKDAADRYQTMAELVLALEAVAQRWAPQVLSSPSGSISAQVSAQHPAVTPSGMRAVSFASGPTPSGLRAVGAEQARASGQGVAADLEVAPPRPRRAALVIGGVVALGGIGAAAYVVLGRMPPPPPVVAPAPPKAADPPKPAEAVPPASAKPAEGVPPASAKDVIVLVDSEPVGAQLLLDGAPIGDTPRNVTLAGGKPGTITIRKHGYAEQSVVLDGKSDARRIVRLVRVATKDPHAGAKELPKPPPAVEPARPAPPPAPPNPRTVAPAPSRLAPPPLVASPPMVPPPPGARPVPRPPGKRAHDPYERVDDSKKSDVMNPY